MWRNCLSKGDKSAPLQRKQRLLQAPDGHHHGERGVLRLRLQQADREHRGLPGALHRILILCMHLKRSSENIGLD